MSETRISRGIALVAHSASNALLARQWLVVKRGGGCETVTAGGARLHNRKINQSQKYPLCISIMTSRARMLKAAQFEILTAVEANPQLLDLLEIATSTSRKVIFIKALLEILPTAFDHSDKKNNEELFNVFTAWCGIHSHSNTHFTGISAALQNRKQYFLEMRFKKRQFISDIGLDWTADDKSSSFSKVISACDIVGKSSCLA